MVWFFLPVFPGQRQQHPEQQERPHGQENPDGQGGSGFFHHQENAPYQRQREADPEDVPQLPQQELGERGLFQHAAGFLPADGNPVDKYGNQQREDDQDIAARAVSERGLPEQRKPRRAEAGQQEALQQAAVQPLPDELKPEAPLFRRIQCLADPEGFHRQEPGIYGQRDYRQPIPCLLAHGWVPAVIRPSAF